jgi:hypothetical protein
MSKLNEKIHLLMEMNVFCEHYNSLDGFIPNWNDPNQEKFGISHFGSLANEEYKPYDIEKLCCVNKFVFGLCVSNENTAKHLLSEFGERLKLYY